LLRTVIAYWFDYLRGKKKIYSITQFGYRFRPTKPVKIRNYDYKKIKNTKRINDVFLQDNIENMIKIIEMCKKKRDAINIFIITPLTEYMLWETENMDEINDFILNFAKQLDCKVIDFNLLKERQKYFSDSNSFYNSNHLSRSGAESFSRVLSDILVQISKNENISQRFYSSYTEAKHFSTYQNLIY
jgi:hypothetical protein